MPTIRGLTSEKSLELAAEWDVVAQKQAAAEAKIAQLESELASARELISEFSNATVPHLIALALAQSTQVDDIYDVIVPNLDALTQANKEALTELQEVTIASIRADTESNYQNILDLPHTFTQDVMPEPDDDFDRPLLVGDRWNDTTVDPPQEYRWSGTEWVESDIEIEDLSLTVRKFNTSTHMIY